MSLRRLSLALGVAVLAGVTALQAQTTTVTASWDTDANGASAELERNGVVLACGNFTTSGARQSCTAQAALGTATWRLRLFNSAGEAGPWSGTVSSGVAPGRFTITFAHVAPLTTLPTMAITTGSSTEKAYSGVAVTSDTTNFTIGSLTNGLLVVTVRIRVATPPSATGITWNGTALTEAGTAGGVSTASWRMQQFYLIAPAAATADLVTSFSGNVTAYYITPTWWNGADQTAPYDKRLTGTGATDPSVSGTPTNADSLLVGGYASEANDILTPTAPQTSLQDHDAGNYVMAEGYTIQSGGPSAETMAWTGADDTWAAFYGVYKPATGGGGGDANAILLGGDLLNGGLLLGRLIQ